MSDIPTTNKQFHPAVPMLAVAWPAVPVGAHAKLEQAQQPVAVEVITGAQRHILVIGTATDASAHWTGHVITQAIQSRHAPIEDLVGLRWHLRDTSSLDIIGKQKTKYQSAARFSLSAEVLKLMRRAMFSVVGAEKSIDETFQAVIQIKDEDIERYVFEKIDNMFFALSDLYHANSSSTPLIASEGGFEPTVKSALFDRFEVSYLEGQSFANSIYRSVWNFVREGGEFGGDWGKVDRVGQNLYMIIMLDEGTYYSDDESVDFVSE